MQMPYNKININASALHHEAEGSPWLYGVWNFASSDMIYTAGLKSALVSSYMIYMYTYQ